MWFDLIPVAFSRRLMYKFNHDSITVFTVTLYSKVHQNVSGYEGASKE